MSILDTGYFLRFLNLQIPQSPMLSSRNAEGSGVGARTVGGGSGSGEPLGGLTCTIAGVRLLNTQNPKSPMLSNISTGGSSEEAVRTAGFEPSLTEPFNRFIRVVVGARSLK